MEVKWRQSCARKVGKGVKGVPKAGNEKIPRYQWRLISRYQYKVDQDINERLISGILIQDIGKKVSGY